jgi:hypothetical protein
MMKDTLKPLGLVLLMAYSAGSPAFEEMRPRAVDTALRGFHHDVTLAAFKGIGLAQAAARIDPWEVAATASVSGRLLDRAGRSIALANAP